MTAKTRIIATPAFKSEQDKLLAAIAQQRDALSLVRSCWPMSPAWLQVEAAAQSAGMRAARQYITLLEAHYAPAFASA